MLSLSSLWLDTAFLPSWTINIHHHAYYRADRRDWPTPVASFFRSIPWVPAVEASRETPNQIEVKPSEIWLMPDSADRFPVYLRHPTSRVRSVLEHATSRQIDILKNRAELRIFNTPNTLAQQTTFLAEQFAREGFDRYFERHLLNLYNRTWELLSNNVDSGELTVEDIAVPDILLVQRGHEVEVLNLLAPNGDVDEILYVRDNDNETSMGLIEASGNRFFSVQTSNPIRVGRLFRLLYDTRVKLLLFSETKFSFIVDGQDVGAGENAPILDHCPRLRVMIATAIEALKGTDLQRLPVDRSSIVAKLELLFIQRASTMSFSIDNKEISHGLDERRAYFVRLDTGQPIIVVRAASGLTWDVIYDCLDAICEAIEQSSLVPHLRLLVTQIKTQDTPHDTSSPLDLDIALFANILRLSEIKKRAIRDTLCAGLERYIPRLRVILHMAGGRQAIDMLAEKEVAAVQDIDLLRETLSPWFERLNLSCDFVLKVCKSALSTTELRELLDLDFASFNQSLIEVGLEPDINHDIHDRCMVNFVHENEIRIIDALRVAHAGQLRCNKPAPTYFEARDMLRKILPNPDWLHLYKEPPEHLMVGEINAWLKDYGAQLNAADNHNLDPIDEVRESNRLTVSKFANKAHPLVLAWCGKAGVTASDIWCEADKSAEALRTVLDKAGIYDFKRLDENSVLRWSSTVGVWPANMPLSLEMLTLKLVPEDLDAEIRKDRAKAESRKREARSIPFNGRMIDPETMNLQDLVLELSSDLSREMLSTPLSAEPNLLRAQRKPGSNGKVGTGKTPSPQKRIPPEKADKIGHLGEIAVYYWLRNRLPKQDIDAAWVSTNALPITGQNGNDSLGYDFEVSYRNQIWQIEVKSSLYDPCKFEMGESEVRAAREAARARSGVQYRIAYVRNISEPANIAVEVLPNPMTAEGESVFQLLGEGIRYGFSRIVS